MSGPQMLVSSWLHFLTNEFTALLRVMLEWRLVVKMAKSMFGTRCYLSAG